MVKPIDFHSLYNNIRQFFLFNLVGAFNFFNHQILFFFLSLNIKNLILGNILAFLIACIFGYFLHVKFTFKIKRKLSNFLNYFFIQSSLFFGCFFILIFIYNNALSFIEILIFNVIFVIANFLLMKFIVFGPSKI
jgi:putative flippase GtrA